MNRLRLTIAILLLFIAALPVSAAEVPAFAGRITDAAGMLTESDYLSLNELLADFEQKTGNQLFVLTIKSLDGEDIEGFSNRAFRAYRVGQSGKNNGVLLVTALNDRKMRIEVGYGLEGVLPDGRAGQIERETIRPYFRAEQYREGIEAGAREIMKVVSPEYQPPATTSPARPQPRPQPVQNPPLLPFAIIGGLILLVIGLTGFANYARKRRCPRCHRWSKQITQTVIEQPTTLSGGYNRQNEYCPACGFAREFFYTTAPLAGGVYWGGGGWGGGWGGGSSGGSSGGSDFGMGGGGDSGGGGASSDW